MIRAKPWWAIVFGGWLAAAAMAVTPVRVVVEGACPAGDHAPAGISLRQAALRHGLGQAVIQLGRELVEADRDGPAPADLDVLEVLGGQPSDFIVRYRVLAERGERAAQLLMDPEISLEYALEIEAQIDVDRVAQGLRDAGLLASLPGEIPSQAHRVVVETSDWRAYEAFLELLRERGEARLAVPERFQAGRVALQVEAPGRPRQLLDRLLAGPPGEIELIPLPAVEADIRLRIELRARPEGTAPPGADDPGN
ncbi:MAG: hypothetical protein GY723_23425 [bacterium]|nr:hypothetical protein [bacterium]MCP5070590.1 hypothetical protein [bacterium]